MHLEPEYEGRRSIALDDLPVEVARMCISRVVKDAVGHAASDSGAGDGFAFSAMAVFLRHDGDPVYVDVFAIIDLEYLVVIAAGSLAGLALAVRQEAPLLAQFLPAMADVLHVDHERDDLPMPGCMCRNCGRSAN